MGSLKEIRAALYSLVGGASVAADAGAGAKAASAAKSPKRKDEASLSEAAREGKDLAERVGPGVPSSPLELLLEISEVERGLLLQTPKLLNGQLGLLAEAGQLVEGLSALSLDLPTRLKVIYESKQWKLVGDQTWALMFSRSSAGDRKLVMNHPKLGVWFQMFTDDGLSPTDLFPAEILTSAFGKAFKGNKGLRDWCYASLESELLVELLGTPASASKCKHLDKVKGDGKLEWLTNGMKEGTKMTVPIRKSLLRLIQKTADLVVLKAMFLERFGKKLLDKDQGDTRAKDIWKVDVVKLLWQQLDVLPDQDVPALLPQYLAVFNATSGGGGTYSGRVYGTEGPANSRASVQIGQDKDISTEEGKKKLAHTVRHEVGHAVHRLLWGEVNKFLEGVVGFKEAETDLAKVVTRCGGWGEVEDTDREEMLKAMRDYVGTGSRLGGAPARGSRPNSKGGHFTPKECLAGWWFKDKDGNEQKELDWAAFNAAKKDQEGAWKFYYRGAPENSWQSKDKLADQITARSGTKGTAAFDAKWEQLPDTVQSFFEESPGDWWNNRKNWVKVGGKRYFWNHWYNKAMEMGDRGNSITDAMTEADNYTCMSPKEFFANCYAEYFQDPAGFTDNSKWGGALPADVKAFMTKVVVDREPYEEAKGKTAGSDGVKR